MVCTLVASVLFPGNNNLAPASACEEVLCIKDPDTKAERCYKEILPYDFEAELDAVLLAQIPVLYFSMLLYFIVGICTKR